MIGKAYLCLGKPEESIPYFEMTRTYAKRGCKDSLDLSFSSYGWQARAEFESHDFISSIHHYLELGDVVSLSMVCRKTLSMENDMLKEVVNDKIARQVLLSWLLSRSKWQLKSKAHKASTHKLLRAIEDSETKEFAVKNADRISWIFYNMGEMEEARRWLNISDQSSAFAKWISSKLLLREGVDC
jgi:hypothetical protein